ncbi:MAG TPA: HAD-IC family P-type ATPase, partial [Aquabacterium sp.]|nr:HAD-IC family P-type ATPase [Aquabacterium sp.]
RLVAASDIRVNASTLTGESLPKARHAGQDPEHVSVLERRNLLLAGTSLVSGEGRAVVFATGMRTEFGHIAHLTQSVQKSSSHLQDEIRRLSRLVALMATGLGLCFFAVGWALGLPFWANLTFAIGIIVANVPEGLLPTVTLSLAMATQRMARRHALIRHLPAVETLGATTVICTDKTGTLTRNSMVVRQLYLNHQFADDHLQASVPGAQHLLRNAAICHSLKLGHQEGRPVWLGDPMEVALSTFAAQTQVFDDMVVSETLAFDSDRRRMSVVVRRDGARWMYCKGAPEVVLPLCDAIEHEGQTRRLEAADRQAVLAAQQAMAGRGLRVLAFGWRLLHEGEAPHESRLVLSGLIGLYDPPRAEVPEALERCRTAGIKVIMV